MLETIKFGNYEFSTYILIIGFSFFITFIIFFRLVEKSISKTDIVYIYLVNIIGFAIGAKLFSLISNRKSITLTNFINSGYSYLGGIIASIIFISLYCYKYKLNFKKIISIFSMLYPLIYSISKVGCFLNGCCNGILKIGTSEFYIPLQLIDSVIMLFLFFILLFQYLKNKRYMFSKFTFGFCLIRFFEDFFRFYRNTNSYNLTFEQILCVIFILIGFGAIIVDKNKKNIP